MHTVIVLSIGFLLLAACSLGSRLIAGPSAQPTATLAFIPLWFIGAGINMYIGVAQAGYSVADEAPVFVVVFAIPAIVAYLIWRKLRAAPAAR